MGTQPSFGKRFKAWWEGYELPVEPETDAPEDETEERKAESGAADRDEVDDDLSQGDDAQPSALHAFRERFKAWWEGCEYQKPPSSDEEPGSEDEPPAREPAEEEPAADEPAAEEPEEGEPAAGERDWERPETEAYGAGAARAARRDGKAAWTPARIKVAERLWGAGFTSPGGAEHVLQLVKPFALDPKMSLLHLGAGLGGPARAIAEMFKISVTGLEASEALAAAASAETTLAGMAGMAPVVSYDPERVKLRARGFDCVFATEAFFTVANKKRLFKTVAKSLTKGGQLLLMDYVLAKTDRVGPAARTWLAHEPVPPKPWSVEQFRQQLEKNKLTIRLADDISDEMCRMVLRDWSRSLASLKPGHIGPELGEALLAEVELWARRIEVLESGEVRFYRFHAVRS